MRSSLIPRSLILVASAALSFGACGGTETQPGTTTSPTTGGAPSTVAGAPSTSAGSPATGAAGAANIPAGTAGTTAGTAGSGASAAGTPAVTPGGTAGTAAAAGTSGGAGTTAAAGAGAGAGAAGSDAAAGGGATFTKVFEEILVGTGCGVGACHGNPNVPSKLGLSDRTDAYTGLVGVMAMGSEGPSAPESGCANKPFVRVKAGDPDNSLLVQKLEGKQMCGKEMPVGGMLKAEQIQLVRDWIMAGAMDD